MLRVLMIISRMVGVVARAIVRTTTTFIFAAPFERVQNDFATTVSKSRHIIRGCIRRTSCEVARPVG